MWAGQEQYWKEFLEWTEIIRNTIYGLFFHYGLNIWIYCKMTYFLLVTLVTQCPIKINPLVPDGMMTKCYLVRNYLVWYSLIVGLAGKGPYGYRVTARTPDLTLLDFLWVYLRFKNILFTLKRFHNVMLIVKLIANISSLLSTSFVTFTRSFMLKKERI